MSEKPEKLTIEEYNLYLKAAINNLGHRYSFLYENLSSEMARLIKLYSVEEIKKKKFGFWK
ncbi:hypothetical protein [Enterococcus cecorum]|uniref:hypothetical protein n=1 Tax=Enterococcus cecorum TaxID=44008 RepID=UPI001FAB5578|nr:hypothetical protein [Enterococcus cecorum]MCJ0536456.1 hypothetical protein [Enterococcus cecorum]MCJ0545861.1 hypothetical protein [Enterococcus cecorum]MCJ0549803.1 hypothetical protein [Enterococcus cecorum]MCJ0568852.1 hypothetical protein [Enterococcus cecorum]